MMQMQRVANTGLVGIANGVFTQHSRNMATLKAISMRLKAVKSIQKFTQTMKLVSVAKYTCAKRALKQARPYGEGAKKFYEQAEIEPVKENQKELLIAVTSDRGLCGAVHSGVGRSIREKLNERTEGNEDTKIACVGDKSRTILQRMFADKFVFVANEIGSIPPTFSDASQIAIEILESGYEFTHGQIVYNKFRSIVSYLCSTVSIFSVKSVEGSEKLVLYDSLDSELLKDYLEYSLASLMFYTLKENSCSEQSARMTAMGNASRNAGEVMDKLSTKYYQTRQIGEMMEIISGASALG